MAPELPDEAADRADDDREADGEPAQDPVDPGEGLIDVAALDADALHESTDDLFAELAEAAAVLDDLDDAARVEAWASSVLGVWAEDPDAGAIDAELVSWLVARADRRADLVLVSVAAVLDPTTADAAAADVDAARARLASDPPAWLDAVGTSVPTRAWLVERHGVRSHGIGFVADDGSQHSLLADDVDGQLTSLIVAPGPDELFDGSEDLVAPRTIVPADAARAIVAAWQAALASGDPLPESCWVNGALARRRLAGLAGPLHHDGEIGRPDTPAAVAPEPLDPDERAELDRWALSILDGALGAAAGVDPARGAPAAGDPAAGDPAAGDPAELDAAELGAPGVTDSSETGGQGTGGADRRLTILLEALRPERIAEQPAVEREAFGALEWADWLGMVIGAVRAGAGTRVDPSWLVDAINRCPEVTSSIPKRDRPYYEWAIGRLLTLWRRAGVVDAEGRLTDDGVDLLPAALRTAWDRA